MDKRLTKILAGRAGVPTPEWRFYRRGEVSGALSFPLPCVVKPVDSGSSIGVAIARTQEELASAVRHAEAQGSGILVEEYIAGRDVQISILGGKLLPSIEIMPGEGFYDYRNKYVPGRALEVTPAPIPPETEAELARYALAVYNELGLGALARADFILDGDNKLWFLEINTLPGMTPTSLAPQEAAAAGMDYEQLCQALIDLAF